MPSDGGVLARGAAAARIALDFRSERAGPCLVLLAGLHGDEGAGVKALERVAHTLSAAKPRARGRLVGVLGNLRALERGVRYLERDLNRGWCDENVAALRAREASNDGPEDAEQRELLAVLDAIEAEAERPVVFLDLHSTSADGPPFSCMPDTLANLRIALELPVPAVLGLEETIQGPLLGYLSDLGHGGLFVEGGRHGAPQTTGVLESCVWVLAAALGVFTSADVPDYGAHWDRLAAFGQGLPRVLEIRHVHPTRAGDGFVMRPGFRHYDRVLRGQLVARDHRGEIRTPRGGRVMMPAYKPGTDQGFFIAADIPPLFVWILFLIRALRLGALAGALPSARREAQNPDLIEVADWVPERLVNVIRLLGWRRAHRGAGRTLLRRRRVRR
ncbi:MAG: succinylglutamate desuccinylase/aspartoacylase family protein [Candidatus Krumholzibacteria bacterium]|nr:succinylglutamate desuccinylase/aspartoacylase family protein [Candidatus Krumholzibacteria bacterium]